MRSELRLLIIKHFRVNILYQLAISLAHLAPAVKVELDNGHARRHHIADLGFRNVFGQVRYRGIVRNTQYVVVGIFKIGHKLQKGAGRCLVKLFL